MAHLLPILAGLANVMEIVTFVQFIEEEAIQSAALGVFLSIRGKSPGGAARGIGLLEAILIPHLKDINYYAGWMAPYSNGCFQDFILATETNVQIYKDIMFARKT